MTCSHDWRWVDMRNISVEPIEKDGPWRHFGFFVCRHCPVAKWQEIEWRDGAWRMVDQVKE